MHVTLFWFRAGLSSLVVRSSFTAPTVEALLCENFDACGVTTDGGFAEYIRYQQGKVYKIHNLSDEEATILEPASCAIDGLDKLCPPVGFLVLLIGTGPTGLILSQLLKMNGASQVVLAANKEAKMDLARKLNAADVCIDLDGKDADAQCLQVKKDYPYGFDIVLEATVKRSPTIQSTTSAGVAH